MTGTTGPTGLQGTTGPTGPNSPIPNLEQVLISGNSALNQTIILNDPLYSSTLSIDGFVNNTSLLTLENTYGGVQISGGDFINIDTQEGINLTSSGQNIGLTADSSILLNATNGVFQVDALLGVNINSNLNVNSKLYLTNTNPPTAPTKTITIDASNLLIEYESDTNQDLILQSSSSGSLRYRQTGVGATTLNLVLNPESINIYDPTNPNSTDNSKLSNTQLLMLNPNSFGDPIYTQITPTGVNLLDSNLITTNLTTTGLASSGDINLDTPNGNVIINGSTYPPVVPADTLEAVLTAGNQATQDIQILNDLTTPTITADYKFDGLTAIDTTTPFSSQANITATGMSLIDGNDNSASYGIGQINMNNNTGSQLITLTANVADPNMKITNNGGNYTSTLSAQTLSIYDTGDTQTASLADIIGFANSTFDLQATLTRGNQADNKDLILYMSATSTGNTGLVLIDDNASPKETTKLYPTFVQYDDSDTTYWASWLNIILKANAETPTLDQVLTSGNTSSNSIYLTNSATGYRGSVYQTAGSIVSASSYYPSFVDSSGNGYKEPLTFSNLSYNPNANQLTCSINGTSAYSETILTNYDSTIGTTYYPCMALNPTGAGYKSVYMPQTISFNASASMGQITATQFVGALVGNAQTATTATTATNVGITSDNTSGTYYIPFAKTSGSGGKPLFIDDATGPLSYNPFTSTLTATTFSGSTINGTSGINIQYNANTKIAITSTGATLTGTLNADTINSNSGLYLNYNGTNYSYIGGSGVQQTLLTAPNTATFSSGTLTILTTTLAPYPTFYTNLITFSGTTNTISAITPPTNMPVGGMYLVYMTNVGSGILTINATGLGTVIKTTYTSAVSVPATSGFALGSLTKINSTPTYIWSVNLVA